MAVKTPIDLVPTNGLFGVSNFLELFLSTHRRLPDFPSHQHEQLREKSSSLSRDERKKISQANCVDSSMNERNMKFLWEF